MANNDGAHRLLEFRAETTFIIVCVLSVDAVPISKDGRIVRIPVLLGKVMEVPFISFA